MIYINIYFTERFPTLYYKICSCPVSCNFRLFETDLSYGTTSDYNLRKYLSSNDTTKFAQDLLNATEVTSRYEDTKLSVVQDFYSTLTNDTEKISNVHERLVTLVDGLINATDVVYQDMKNHYDFKDFLYKYQIYIMQKNFMRARDAMEERHIHIVPLAYTEFILLIEKSIRKLADTQFPNDTSRLVIYGNLNDKIDSRLEITERVIANYTSLRDAYIAGQKIFNYKYMDIPRAHNNPATPKKLIQDSVNHNSYANKSTVQFESFINKSVVTLNLCKDLAGIAYASYTVKEADLWLCVEDYRHAMRNWMYARSLFYYEIVERPERILQERLENFESLWTEFQLMFQNINQSLYSIRSENTDFGSDILTSIENSNRQLEQYLVANATKLSLSEDFLSNTTEDVLSKLTLYFQILKTRQTTLTDWISRLQSSAGDIWQNILNDEDSYDYYTYINKNEYLKNFTEIESDLKSNFSTILGDVKFTDVIDGQDGQLLSTFNNIIAHMKEFQEALKVDSDFIRYV